MCDTLQLLYGVEDQRYGVFVAEYQGRWGTVIIVLYTALFRNIVES